MERKSATVVWTVLAESLAILSGVPSFSHKS